MEPFYEPGRYGAEVVNQALGKAKTGTPQFVLKCKILYALVNGEQVGLRQQYERSIFMYLSENAAKYTIEKLQEIGFDGSSFRQLDLSHANPCDFRTKQIMLDCKHEEDQNGVARERWDLAWTGSGEIEITPLDAAEIRKLDSLFGKSLGGAKSQPKPAQHNRAAKEEPVTIGASVQYNPEVNDDDIPF